MPTTLQRERVPETIFKVLVCRSKRSSPPNLLNHSIDRASAFPETELHATQKRVWKLENEKRKAIRTAKLNFQFSLAFTSTARQRAE
ncbi:hypothetical protein IRJ41_001693 [Triplophysa rosa]|uniref:Uncharacterized protein n=1 Tax=Triplophysa rosa TaxID=992332 RepID=A0A9W7TUD9_TRIRA|nr:hypothetical protein IRJ41_001693 [Triplophysa rosa]